jgi:hypothetical protein
MAPKRRQMKHLDFVLLLVRDQGVETSILSAVSFSHKRNGKVPAISAWELQTMRHGVPLLCRALHSDQLQVLDFLNRDTSDSRAGWFAASH